MRSLGCVISGYGLKSIELKESIKWWAQNITVHVCNLGLEGKIWVGRMDEYNSPLPQQLLVLAQNSAALRHKRI